MPRSRLSPWWGGPGRVPAGANCPPSRCPALRRPVGTGVREAVPAGLAAATFREGSGMTLGGVPGAPGPDPHSRGGGILPARWSPASSICHFPFLQPFLGKLFTSENFLPPFFLPAPSAFSSRRSLARKGSGCGLRGVR